MSHPAQRSFFRQVKRKFPNNFRNALVADIGSLDINGNNKSWFRRCDYYGIDIVKGKNVDIVGRAHIEIPKLLNRFVSLNFHKNRGHLLHEKFHTIVSSEMLEHDEFYKESLLSMYESLYPGGLLVITCAGVGRLEHGTHNRHPGDSPGTNDYYQNITNPMFSEVLPASLFNIYHLEQVNTDLQFYGVKKSN